MSTPAPGAFLDLADIDATELRHILEKAKKLKASRAKARKLGRSAPRPFAGKVLAMIFDKPSTRTRVSFDIGMRELGGETLMLTGAEMQLGRGETIADTARVLSRFVDVVVARILSHDDLLELAYNSAAPVINGLTKYSHPCQIMADLLTFEEYRGSIQGASVAWVGDSNNVLNSWIHAAQKFDFSLKIAAPKELSPCASVLDWAHSQKARIEVLDEPQAAVEGADAVVTDCWVSMGDEPSKKRDDLLSRYQVNADLMRLAHKDAIFMHCLPAHRGEEVTDEVMDGPQSVVFDEAENRLHAQKGILAWTLDPARASPKTTKKQRPKKNEDENDDAA